MISLHAELAALPADIRTIWQTRYMIGEDMDGVVRHIIRVEAAEVRAEGSDPDAIGAWIRLVERLVAQEAQDPALRAPAALVALAAGLRTQGFDAAGIAAAQAAAVEKEVEDAAKQGTGEAVPAGTA